jgi:hypothetical protein
VSQPSVLKRMRMFTYLGALAMGLSAIAAACASTGKDSGGGFGSSGSGSGGSGSGNDSGCFGCSSGRGICGVVGFSTCSATYHCNDFAGTANVDCSSGDCILIDPKSSSTVPSNPASLFGSPSASGGPCLVEPQDGTLFPNGWLRPRISYAPVTPSQTLFQIRVHSDSESNDLVVYTASTNWTLDNATWTTLSTKLVGPTLTVTVTAANANGGGSVASSQPASFSIAPVPAPGALIYWTTASYDNNATTTNLKGFHVGDEGTTIALMSSQVAQPVDAVPVDGGNITSGKVGVYCIGCHTSTPDGNYVAFTAQWPWPNALASVNAGDGGVPVGAQPTWLTAGAAANLSPLIGPASIPGEQFYAPPVVNQSMLGVETFSAQHYATGDRKVISSLGAAQNSTAITAPNTFTGVVSQLAWFDLEWKGTATTTGFAAAPCNDPNHAPPGPCVPPPTSNGGWGIIQRQGNNVNLNRPESQASAGAPSWSHTNIDTIAYVSTDVGTKDGRLDQGTGDIYLVPYGGGGGGNVTPLGGASDPNFNEYYPAWAPDDTLIAFNRVASQYSMYNQPQAEVYVVESGPVSCDGANNSAQCRLKANDPVACTNSKSPGVQNTWPKWAPLPNTGSSTQAGNQAMDGKLYYWVTFSSTRATACTVTATSGAPNTLCNGTQSSADLGRAQLYVAGIVVDPSNGNAITTYPAIYMWNQDGALNNLIPAWDYFPIAKGNQQSVN